MSKGYIGFTEGMIIGESIGYSSDTMKYMDWSKAEQICKEHPNSVIYAGLQEDWGYTSGKIFDHGEYFNGGDLYDQSKWATPILDVDGKEIECWTKEPHEHTGIPEDWGEGAKVKSTWDDCFFDEHELDYLDR